MGALRFSDGWLGVAAIFIGAVAAGATRRAIAWPALLIGILVSYPAAMALGVIVGLGESWEYAVILALAGASIGFVETHILANSIRGRRTQR